MYLLERCSITLVQAPKYLPELSVHEEEVLVANSLSKRCGVRQERKFRVDYQISNMKAKPWFNVQLKVSSSSYGLRRTC